MENDVLEVLRLALQSPIFLHHQQFLQISSIEFGLLCQKKTNPPYAKSVMSTRDKGSSPQSP